MKRHLRDFLVILAIVAVFSVVWRGAKAPDMLDKAVSGSELDSGSRPLMYSTRGGGKHQIHAVNVDGGAPRQIWEGEGGSQTCFPSLSPDGRWVAFVAETTEAPRSESSARGGRDERLCLIPAEGGEVRVLAGQLHLGYWIIPQWSPNGTHVLFEKRIPQNQVALEIVNVESGETTEVTSGQHAQWSPDGSRIVFKNGRAVVIMTLDGSSPPVTLNVPGERPHGYQWSPDGKTLALNAGPQDKETIYLADPVLGKCTPIQEEGRYPYWSPDGKRIVFDSFRGQSSRGSRIFVMDADGKNSRLLCEQPGSRPKWRGDHIAFSGRDGEDWAIWAVNPDGSDLHKVASPIQNIGFSW